MFVFPAAVSVAVGLDMCTVTSIPVSPAVFQRCICINLLLYAQCVLCEPLLSMFDCAGYGTYVVRRYSVQIVRSDCSDASVVMLKVLVYSSWAMLAFNWY